jgi:hypothetical protein
LGSEASLTAVNTQVEGHPKCATNPTWLDTIRRVVRHYKIFQPLVPKKRIGICRPVTTPVRLRVPELTCCGAAGEDGGGVVGLAVARARESFTGSAPLENLAALAEVDEVG